MRTATPVNFTLDLNGRSGPRSSQVAHALIDAIARGQVHDGDRLPSTRTLAATFGLARTAVVAAYEELTAAGFLVARPGGSTYVERGAGDAARAGAFGTVLSGASGAGLPPPTPSAPRPAIPITYDLRPGLADPGLISERDWTRAMRMAASPARQPPLDLRDQLTGHLRRARGLAVDPEDIFLFPSVSNALRACAVACGDRKSTRLNSSHVRISYAVFCLKTTSSPSSEGTAVAHSGSIYALGGRDVTQNHIYLRYFFFNDTATTEIYTLSLHDALPISACAVAC